MRNSVGALLCSALVLYVVAVAERIDLEAPSPTPILLDQQGYFLAQFGVNWTGPDGTRRTEYGYWPLEALPERVVAATLALEDKRFWDHPGVDGLAVLRAVWQAARSGRARSGASTVAMQVVRMQHPAPRNLWNKLVEAGAAIWLIRRYGQNAVLRHYLRIAPYGNGSHGIAHAARRYFDKPATDLSWAEIAFLTAIPQAPGRMNPYKPEGRRAIVRRGTRLLELLAERGVIGAEERRLAETQLQTLQPLECRKRPPYLHAILHVGRLLERNGPPRDKEPILRATLDLALQREVARLVGSAWPEWQELGAEQAAVLVVERAGFAVRAALGSLDYFRPPAGALDFVHVPRSPGSTLKPFLYALALEQDLVTPATRLPDWPEGSAGIGNADGRFLGPLLPRQALANSRNVPAIHLLRRVGLNSFFGLLDELELVPGSHRRDPARFGLALVLGGLPTTLERLVRAYGALAADGRLPALRWYEGQPLPAPRPVLSAGAARQVTLFLADPMARLPSFPRYGPTDYPFPVALKTGTSQGYRDAWIVAYSSDYLVGVWIGRSDADPMRGLTGGRAPAALARAILLHLHQSRPGDLRDGNFPPPAGYLPVEMCLHWAELPDRCGQTLREWVPPDLLAEVEPSPPTPLPMGQGSRRERGFDDETPVEIAIVAPEQNTRLWRNPEAPAAVNRIALKAVVKGGVSQIVWYVDDEPFGVVDADKPLYWPLRKGVHQFQVRLPYREERSRPVRVVVE
ncbi:MAG TPA: transglycosylase domain-containing protein [Candidatus Competibacter sp.]|nr:transglycosylase domain-containing protein [Candidatus Competibacter sp.]